MTNGRILIVYSDAEVGVPVQNYFIEKGYQTRWFLHAWQALTSLNDFAPDVLILENSDVPEQGYDDAHMAELVRQFDAIERVMFLVANPKVRIIEESFEYRPTYQLLTLPFDVEELELRVRHMLGTHRKPKPRLLLVETDQWVCQYITSHLTKYMIDVFTPDEALTQLKSSSNTFGYKLVLLANELEVGDYVNFELEQLDAANVPIFELCWKRNIPVIFLCNQQREPPFPDWIGDPVGYQFDVVVKWYRSKK